MIRNLALEFTDLDIMPDCELSRLDEDRLAIDPSRSDEFRVCAGGDPPDFDRGLDFDRESRVRAHRARAGHPISLEPAG
jgi:hypothetical protein